MASELVWLRRDLRRRDLPLLAAAADGGGEVAVAFVVDPALWDPAGAPRRTWLAATLLALRDSYEGRLTVRTGDPREVVPELAVELGAKAVHISAETEPDGSRRDTEVEAALHRHDIPLLRTGSPYAVTPGRLRKADGKPYRVFTPFLHAWREHGWRGPALEPSRLRLAADRSDPAVWQRIERTAAATTVPLPAAGEAAAAQRWAWFLDEALADYATQRDRPDLDGTSRLSPYLKFGVVHPRTLLADLVGRTGRGAERFRTELAWREFYADVLHHNPASQWDDLTPALASMPYDDDPDRVDAWRSGRTGFPIVDAGMRHLLAEGWMPNRLRMVVASFLVKHLHTRWQVGAGHFLDHLLDADIASNQHGWQWVAGTGTDPAPYFRVFNPTLQGKRFDPAGDYVRRWIPELGGIAGAAVHEPWKLPGGERGGYPEPIVDLAYERAESIARWRATRGEGR